MNSSTSPVDIALRQLVILFTTVALAVCSFAFTPKAFAVDSRACSEGGVCAVGDIGPGGGTVFFVKSSGDFVASKTVTRNGFMGPTSDTVTVSLTSGEQAALTFDYLEIAAYSAVVLRKWANTVSWTATATIDTRIGSGQSGTNSIVAAYPSQNASNNAAHYANAYSINGKDDWFLPAQDELALATIRHFDGVLGLNNPISEDISRGTLSPGNFYGWTTTPTSGVPIGAGVKIDPQWSKAPGLSDGADASVLPIRAFSFQEAPPASSPSNSSTVVSTPTVEAEPETAEKPKPAKLRFGIGQSELPSSQRSTIRVIASTAVGGASFVVTGGVGYLPGPSTNDMLALARQRATVIQKVLLEFGVRKSKVQIQTRIYDQGTPVQTKLKVIPATND
jgi:outer membrane protein OmpA-like peptidoglycan-associated protein